MNITITLDDEKVTKLLNDELENIPKEDIQSILREAIIKYIEEKDILRGLLVQKQYRSYSTYDEPTDLLRKACNSLDLSPAFKNIQDEMIKYLKENEEALLVKMLKNLMISGMSNSEPFRYAMEECFYNMHYQSHSNDNN